MTSFTSTPAVRILTSPTYGPMAICPAEDGEGFEAWPMDPSVGLTYGLLALYAPDMPSMVAWVHRW